MTKMKTMRGRRTDKGDADGGPIEDEDEDEERCIYGIQEIRIDDDHRMAKRPTNREDVKKSDGS